MPPHLISDVHEWINEIPTVPIHYLAKPAAKGTDFVESVGKEHPVELDSSDLVKRQERCSCASEMPLLLLFFLLIGWSGGEPQGSFSGLKPPFAGGDPSPRHRQVESLAGAAHLSNANTGVLR